jgi:hypothetical protein
MAHEEEGILIEKMDVVHVNDKFSKQEFVIKTTGEYPQEIKFQLTNNSIEALENVSINDNVKVAFSISGRRWEKDGKTIFFTNLDAFRIKHIENGGKESVQTSKNADASKTNNNAAQSNDLPF